MIKVHILTQCDRSNGQAILLTAYLPNGKGEDQKGRKHSRYAPCPMSEGRGNQPI
jgi:hypothetical protein